MTNAGTRGAVETDLEILEGLCREIGDLLSRAKAEIDREIRSYPTPIARCDAQFNHLHDQRGRVGRELERLGTGGGEPREGKERLEAVEGFVASAAFTDDPAELELRSRVGAQLLALAERVRA